MIPGVGALISAALAAHVADPFMFRSGRDFAAWLGLVPRQNFSGGKEKLGNYEAGQPLFKTPPHPRSGGKLALAPTNGWIRWPLGPTGSCSTGGRGSSPWRSPASWRASPG